MNNDKEENQCDQTRCGSCGDKSCPSASTQAQQPPKPDDAKLKSRLSRIRRKVIVMSGKGGVGKSTVAVNLAMSAMLSGQKVGLLDVDLHGPSVPIMLGLVGQRLEGGPDGMVPVEVGGLKVLSVGFLLNGQDDPVIWRGPMKMGVIRQFIEDVDLHGPSVPIMLGLVGQRLESGENGMQPVEIGGLKVLSVGFLLKHPDDPVIWRGPMKMSVIRQFIEDVDWGELDLLVIDSPPGTGDEPLTVCQLIPELDGAVIVTTPQKVAAADVRKSISFCREIEVPVLGVIENMSGFACPKCGEVTAVLRAGGGREMAEQMRVPFLGSIPIDPLIAVSGDEGKAFVESAAGSPAAGIFREILRTLIG